MPTITLAPELLIKMDAYWRAANYLSVGQIYLYDNPLLRRPLTLADVKHMLLGHWGTTPWQNFIWHGQDMPEIRDWKWNVPSPSAIDRQP
jgi:xylulose-5-phosphate/fructose-6-phosphate phosphoketolase